MRATRLASGGSLPVDVYGGILAAAVEAFLLSATTTSAVESAALSAEFNVDLWPDAAEADIDQVLAGRGAANIGCRAPGLAVRGGF